MNQFQAGKSLMALENYECNCFGEVKTELQFFLVKQRGTEVKTPSMTNLPQLAHLPNGQLKSSLKRSLRRTNTDLGSSPQTRRKSSQNEEGCSLKDSYEMGREKERNQITSAPSQEVASPEKSSCSNEESSKLTDTPTRTAVLFNTASCQNISPAAQNHPLHFTPSPTRTTPQPHSPTPSIRINFNQTYPPSPQTTLLQPPQLSPSLSFPHQPAQKSKYQPINPHVFFSLKEIKEQINLKITPANMKQIPMSSIEELSEIDPSVYRMERLNNSHTPNKDLKGFSGKEDTFKSSLRYDAGKMKLDIAKSRIDTLKSRIDTGKSKIQTGKSRIDNTNKSRIETKKSLVADGLKHRVTSHRLKDNRLGLKKMDDVEEIHSLPDEDEREDSDQQSVVLGRLHEYGSMVDPRMDEAPSSPTIASKLISLKTQQSSTIGKSYVRSFDFVHERQLFK